MTEKWLVIDDSATIQRVIKLAFQDYDVQITEADSIQDALREFMRSPSSLVIADAALSGVQSVQDFVRLQQTAPNAAYVILQGSYDHIDENQFRGAGFRFFLKKPFDAQQLIAITREALGRKVRHRFKKDDDQEPMPSSSSSSPSPSSSSLSSPSLAAQDSRVTAPPVPPSAGTRSLHEELENPFEGNFGFDLGLDQELHPELQFDVQSSKTPAESSPPSRQDSPVDSRPLRSSGFTMDPEPASTRADKGTSGPTSNELTSARVREANYSSGLLRTKPDKEKERVSAEQGLDASSPTRGQVPNYSSGALSGMLEPMLRDEMEKIVRQTVEEYCRKHFADLAREYLAREIEKLSSERARLLVDK